ncbi:MAG: NAD-dependent epimerase/dehydratase family protein [Candidatus Heimdallarchaeaceae archaeon]
MVVLITGPSSPVSRQLVQLLLEDGYSPQDLLILIHSSLPDYLSELKIPYVRGDITDNNSSNFYTNDIELVFHIAGETRDVRAEQYYSVNYLGTKNLLSQFIRHDSERFILLSSVGVYGFKLPPTPINEDFPKRPTHAYNRSKWLAEKYTFEQAKQHGFFASAIRPPFIIGPYDRRASVAFFDFVSKEKSIPLIAKGKAILSFAHNKDVARALLLASKHDSASGEAFNIVSFTATLREFLDAIAHLQGKQPHYLNLSFSVAYIYAFLSELKSKISQQPSSVTRRRVNQVGRTRIYDTTKIEQKLTFEPEYDMKKTLEEIHQEMTLYKQ